MLLGGGICYSMKNNLLFFFLVLLITCFVAGHLVCLPAFLLQCAKPGTFKKVTVYLCL